MIELILPGLLAGIILTFATGPLGSFIIWRNMSYFGETLAHASFLGIACSVLLNISVFYSIIIITICIALSLVWMETLTQFTIDTFLGIIAHSFLSLGLVIMSLMNDSYQINVMGYLFGDILAITYQDICRIGIVILLLLTLIIWKWKHLLLVIISPELAYIDGISLIRIKLLLTLLIAILISLGIQFVGVLIITSLLVIPAATARRISYTPETMAITSSIIGMLSVILGIIFSTIYNTPSGPTIVLSSSILFLFSLLLKNKC